MLNLIREDLLKARKERNNIKSNLLNILYSECIKIGKDNGNRDPTEQEIINTISKFIKNNNITLDNLLKTNREEDIQKIKIELDILNNYLPKRLTEVQLTSVINEFVSNTPGCKIGDIMQFLKINYNNQYDNKLASNIIKGAS
jgi:uncharacterized protein YqeY